MPEDNEAVLRRAVRRWNEGDLAGYLELYGANAVLHGYQGVEPGFEDIRRFYEAFWVAFPGGQLSLDDVISEVTLRATHTGEFNGMPPTGRQVARTGITILRFTGGRCVERWTQADQLGLMQQLGAVPQPEQAGA